MIEFYNQLKNRIFRLVARSRIQGVSGSPRVLQVDGGPGDLRDEIPQLEPYGLTAHPNTGFESIVIYSGGKRDGGYSILTHRPGSPPVGELKAGDVAVYTEHGAHIKLDATGITIKGSDVELTEADGVVTKRCACVLGGFHPDGSTKVMAEK